MQKSYQYVRICIHVNLLLLFLDIMSYLITMTSVEEESSFPLPTQNPAQGAFGGDHMLRGLCGRGRTPTAISRGCHMAFVLPSSQLPSGISAMLGMGWPKMHEAHVKDVGWLPRLMKEAR